VWAARLRGGGLAVTLSDLVRVDAQASRTPQLSQSHSLAVDVAGNAWLAWGEDGGVYGSASAAGSTAWSAAQQLDGNTSFSWGTVDLAAGDPGQALLSWSVSSEDRALPLGISGGAPAPGALKTLTTGSNLQGATVAARGSRQLAAWVEGGAIHAQTRNAGVWGQPATVTSTGLSYYATLALAMNGAGQAVLLWRDSSAGSGDGYAGVAMASFWNGAAWSQPQLISLPGAARKAWWLSVDLDDNGTAVAAWTDFDASGAYARTWANVLRTDSGAPVWQGPVPIDQASPGVYLADKPENYRSVHVKLDPMGRGAYVVWLQHGQGSDPTPRTWWNRLE
jgi:hypothetical protein